MRILILLDCVGDPRPMFASALAEAGLAGVEVTVVSDAVSLSAAALNTAVAGATALVTPLTLQVDGSLLDAAGDGLRVVSNYAVGFDNIDVEGCTDRGVTVCNGPPPMTEPTADLAWTLLLGAARRVREGLDLATGGTWSGYDANLLLGHRLVGGTLLVVGAGRIGTAVARRSLGWDMDVLYTARTDKPHLEAEPIAATRTTLEAGLPLADAVVVTTALTPETRHMIDAAALARMKSTAVLVNVSRGPVVDEAALADALAAGTIFAAGLDVYENEPRIHEDLVDLPNALLLPHIASATVEDRKDLTEICVENVVATLAGDTPPHVVAFPARR
ncbi:MAG: D-glycerate dehydrogenase [Phycisphaera sp.]|nr:D-glycerate dehydrogenase [Phycisphaera sp.]